MWCPFFRRVAGIAQCQRILRIGESPNVNSRRNQMVDDPRRIPARLPFHDLLTHGPTAKYECAKASPPHRAIQAVNVIARTIPS